jgi:hypothetical protein
MMDQQKRWITRGSQTGCHMEGTGDPSQESICRPKSSVREAEEKQFVADERQEKQEHEKREQREKRKLSHWPSFTRVHEVNCLRGWCEGGKRKPAATPNPSSPFFSAYFS